MKKLISFFLILTMFLALAPAAMATDADVRGASEQIGTWTDDDGNIHAFDISAETPALSPPYASEIDGDWEYVAAGGEAIVRKYNGSAARVTIPSQLGGCTVTAIGDCAFQNNKTMTEVTIPDGIVSIGLQAFEFCYGLTGLSIPDSVVSIGPSAFQECNNMTSFDLGGGVTSIAAHAFNNCRSLASMTIPKSVTEIGNSAFGICDSLPAIKVASGNPAFKAVDGVLFSKDGTLLHTYPAGKSGTSYAIPSGVTSIRDGAFSGHSELTDVTIHAGVTDIEIYAFGFSLSLRNITVDAGNPAYKDVDGVLFTKDGTLLHTYPVGRTSVSYVIPSGVTSVANYAFFRCDAIRTVAVPDGVTTFGLQTFSYCYALTDVTLPASLTDIPYAAFRGSDALSDVWYAGTQDQWEQIEIGEDNEPILNAAIHFESTIPGVPELVSATEVKGGVEFIWKASAGAAKYRVLRKVGSGSWSKLAETEDTVYTDTSAKAGTTYAYSVRAIDAEGNLSAYDKTGLTVKFKGSTLGVPELTSVTMKSNGVQFKWKAAEGAAKYRVYRKVGSGSWKYIGATSKTTYTDKKVTAGKTYSYTARAVDADGKLGKYDKTGLKITYIAVPELVSVKRVSSGVKFTWKAATGAVKYSVYRKTGSGSWKYIGATSKTSYTDKKVTVGKTYSYTVRGKDAYGHLSAYNTTGKRIKVS